MTKMMVMMPMMKVKYCNYDLKNPEEFFLLNYDIKCYSIKF